MNGFRQALRLMIAAGSVTGFFSGWMMLAHTTANTVSANATPATAQAAGLNQATLPPLDLKALAPQGEVPSTTVQIQTQDNQAQVQLQPLQPLPSISQQPSQGFMPRLRSSGS